MKIESHFLPHQIFFQSFICTFFLKQKNVKSWNGNLNDCFVIVSPKKTRHIFFVRNLFAFYIFHLDITTVVFIIIFIVIYFIFVCFFITEYLWILFSSPFVFLSTFHGSKKIYIKYDENIHFWIENSKPQKTARKFLAKSETRERHNHLLFLLTNVAHLKIVQAFVAHFPTLRKM